MYKFPHKILILTIIPRWHRSMKSILIQYVKNETMRTMNQNKLTTETVVIGNKCLMFYVRTGTTGFLNKRSSLISILPKDVGSLRHDKLSPIIQIMRNFQESITLKRNPNPNIWVLRFRYQFPDFI